MFHVKNRSTGVTVYCTYLGQGISACVNCDVTYFDTNQTHQDRQNCLGRRVGQTKRRRHDPAEIPTSDSSGRTASAPRFKPLLPFSSTKAAPESSGLPFSVGQEPHLGNMEHVSSKSLHPKKIWDDPMSLSQTEPTGICRPQYLRALDAPAVGTVLRRHKARLYKRRPVARDPSRITHGQPVARAWKQAAHAAAAGRAPSRGAHTREPRTTRQPLTVGLGRQRLGEQDASPWGTTRRPRRGVALQPRACPPTRATSARYTRQSRPLMAASLSRMRRRFFSSTSGGRCREVRLCRPVSFFDWRQRP